MNKLIVLALSVLLVACGSPKANNVDTDKRVGSLPNEVKYPSDNPNSSEKTELGRMLFWDPILSGNKDVACVTCHHPDAGYADDLDVSIGVGGQGLAAQRQFGVFALRNAPTILNTAFNGINSLNEYDPLNTSMFWDNRGVSLEDQALGPIHSEEEMRGKDYTEAEILGVVITRLENNAEYVDLFTQAFGDGTIDGPRIAKAIATFERSIINNNTRFDQYARGDTQALTKQEVRGLNLFVEHGCVNCHNGPMFSDFKLHRLPVPVNNKQKNDMGVDKKFRTPTLRNLAFTAPYMHNGTKSDLKSAISFYHGISNPSNDPDLNGVNIPGNDDTIEALEAFLLTLSDSNFDKVIPQSVPSGLNPGGDI